MNLQVRNSDTTFNIREKDLNFTFRLGPYRRRAGVEKRYGKSGGKVTGDRQVDARDIKINFNNVSENDTAYIAKLEELLGIFRLDKEPFYLEDIDNNRRCEVELSSLNDRPVAEGLELRVGDNNIDLIMLDGHWEDLDETIVGSDSNGLANGESITVTNDANVECYPIFTIAPYMDNSEFSIINNTTGALFTLSTAGFIVGTEFIVNGQTGKIFLSDGISQTELSSALVDGSGIINFVPGENQILYESIFGAVDVQIEFRRRYAF